MLGEQGTDGFELDQHATLDQEVRDVVADDLAFVADLDRALRANG